MSTLNHYRALCFDVYGTLIDWESGILAALEPLLAKDPSRHFSREHLLTAYHELEREQQRLTPNMPYSQLLSTIHPLLAQSLDLPAPSPADSISFGDSVGSWPAFPDTVDALQRLSKKFTLVVLSNVDRASFATSNAGSLQAFPFDSVITAQDIGSYKPDPRNFEYIKKVLAVDFGIEPGRILATAQSQFHDHQPARRAGIKSVWIERPGATMGNRDDPIFDWRFGTLGEMANAVEREGSWG
ncbi:Haloacid dehalogenase type II [Penicillium capsulatum]|uniref:Haloacid dehalogenase type II n=1 Tax=Penicillium capsulatum TaxID=69766 RepID=A0A9W9HZ84_9EURO|nr:Haloacid dehalogenase type II [Penicillium capsulatum]KAJ6116988.1 Haloacid dehalogenase type II [Penicillium capsulatum]